VKRTYHSETIFTLPSKKRRSRLPNKSVDMHEAATLRASALAAARTYFSTPIKMGFQMYVEGRWLASSLWLLLGAMAVRRLATRR